MKLTLLIIPILLLSSCTIDWNGEQDAKIAELVRQIYELEKENTDKIKLITDLQDQNRELFLSGNLLEIRNAECRANLEYATKNGGKLINE